MNPPTTPITIGIPPMAPFAANPLLSHHLPTATPPTTPTVYPSAVNPFPITTSKTKMSQSQTPAILPRKKSSPLKVMEAVSAEFSDNSPDSKRATPRARSVSGRDLGPVLDDLRSSLYSSSLKDSGQRHVHLADM